MRISAYARRLLSHCAVHEKIRRIIGFMTFKQIIEYTDAVCPSAYDSDTKLLWLSEAEAAVRCEMHGEAVGGEADISLEDEASVPNEYCRLYAYYIFAMTDYLNRDLERYRLSAELYERAAELYAKYCMRTKKG